MAKKVSKTDKLRTYYIDNWYLVEGVQELLKVRILNFQHLLDYRGPGVYRIDHVEIDPETNEELRSITGLYGESEDIGMRWLQYTRRWLGAVYEKRGDYFTYYTGIPKDFEDRWKIRFSVVAKDIPDASTRIYLERQYICSSSQIPFLHDPVGGKYPLFNPHVCDCCICPFNGAREKAFRDALNRQEEKSANQAGA